MKLLISFVNSSISLAGYDWESGEIFWSVPSNKIRSCGICYHESDLLVASDDRVLKFARNGDTKIFKFTGQHSPLLHSVHVIDRDTFGTVDTGNSAVRIIDNNGIQTNCITPLEAWGNLPKDAIHLNDLVMTPHGLLASSFDYRPWRVTSGTMRAENWHNGGYGLVINVTGGPQTGAGCIVGCGFNHPHSLTYVAPHLYLCSSTTGTFSVCSFNNNGTIVEDYRHKITKDHFLRGAYCYNDGWFLGGSTNRHGEVISENVEIYHLTPSTGETVKKEIRGKGEIYDILPWKDEIMSPIINR
jgi:hypothetical protein